MSNNKREWFGRGRPRVAVAARGGRGRVDVAKVAATRLVPLLALLLCSAPSAIAFLNDLVVDAQRGFVYIAVNQLHRAPALNGGVEGGQPPYRIMRVYTGSEGVPGR
jgi:hypothetical protein